MSNGALSPVGLLMTELATRYAATEESMTSILAETEQALTGSGKALGTDSSGGASGSPGGRGGSVGLPGSRAGADAVPAVAGGTGGSASPTTSDPTSSSQAESSPTATDPAFANTTPAGPASTDPAAATASSPGSATPGSGAVGASAIAGMAAAGVAPYGGLLGRAFASGISAVGGPAAARRMLPTGVGVMPDGTVVHASTDLAAGGAGVSSPVTDTGPRAGVLGASLQSGFSDPTAQVAPADLGGGALGAGAGSIGGGGPPNVGHLGGGHLGGGSIGGGGHIGGGSIGSLGHLGGGVVAGVSTSQPAAVPMAGQALAVSTGGAAAASTAGLAAAGSAGSAASRVGGGMPMMPMMPMTPGGGGEGSRRFPPWLVAQEPIWSGESIPVSNPVLGEIAAPDPRGRR